MTDAEMPELTPAERVPNILAEIEYASEQLGIPIPGGMVYLGVPGQECRALCIGTADELLAASTLLRWLDGDDD